MKRESFNTNWTFKKGADGLFSPPAEVCSITLPHDAMILETRDKDCPNGNMTGFYPGGTYTYKKVFQVPAGDRDLDVIIEFEGVYENAMVYINGDLAGQRPYGYSNFYIKANDFLKFGAQNEISVIARTGAMPNSRWYSGSGIYRNVKIMKADPLHIALDGVRIITKSVDQNLAAIEIAVTVENTGRLSRGARLATVITDSSGHCVASDNSPVTAFAGDTFTVRRQLAVAKPSLWSPDAPNLYYCSCQILDNDKAIDEAGESFGIRTISLDTENGLRINGQTVKMRGTCIHHDNGVIGSVTLERAEERRAEMLKAAGFNAIRSAHHPMSKAMLAACDRLGLMVMDEAFDMWTSCKTDYDYANNFGAWWEKDIEAMVAKDFNHPCVIMYSVGNEIFELGSGKGAHLNRMIAEKVRVLDSSRILTNCVNGFLAALPRWHEIIEELAASGAIAKSADSQKEGVGEINQLMMNIFGNQDKIAGSRQVSEMTEEVFAGLDAAGYNYMVSRYESDRTLYPNRVIVGSETCPPDIGRIWPLVQSNSHVIGDFTWVGWDYLGEAGCGSFDYNGNAGFFKPYPARLAFSGDIDITGHRRPMSYYREIVFGLRQEPYIAVQRVNRYGQKVAKSQWCGNDTISSWTWPGFEGQTAIVEVFSDADEVELLLNGQSLGRQPAGQTQNFIATFETTYQPGCLVAVNYRKGNEAGRMQLATAGGELYLQIDADRFKLKSDGADLSYLMISLTDGLGILNMSRELPVTISIDGAGVLQGFGNADPYGTEDFFSPTKTTFDGKVLAVVRALDVAGEIRISASAPGCETCNVVLLAE